MSGKREIKFRYFDNSPAEFGGQRIIGWEELDQLDSEGLVTFIDVCKRPEDEKGVVLMQYTGLKDRNGVEIYEGDVLCDGENHSIDKVTQDKTGAWIWDDEHISDFDYMLEVIGNIHENPELMEQP